MSGDGAGGARLLPKCANNLNSRGLVLNGMLKAAHDIHRSMLRHCSSTCAAHILKLAPAYGMLQDFNALVLKCTTEGGDEVRVR